MQSSFLVLAQLILVTFVYIFAYRTGYRDAQSKAVSTVRNFAEPVTCLLDQLNVTMDETGEDEDQRDG